MQELRYIEVATGRKIRNQRVGTYQSPLRGPGFDFDEHQPYRPGDDVRRIDWNVTARMGAPFVRHTHAEREMNVMVAMDVSRSMALGTTAHSKREAMTYISGLDPVLRAVGSDQRRASLRSPTGCCCRRRRSGRARRRGRCSSRPGRSSRPRRRRCCCRSSVTCTSLKRMSVIFIVSDFVTDDDVLASPELAQLAPKHDVIAVVPEDRAETELPAGAGYVQMRDIESGRRRVGRPRASGARPAMPPRSRAPRGVWPARSTASRWTTCSCRPPAARCCRCCRSLPGEKRDPPPCFVLAGLLSLGGVPRRPSPVRTDPRPVRATSAPAPGRAPWRRRAGPRVGRPHRRLGRRSGDLHRRHRLRSRRGHPARRPCEGEAPRQRARHRRQRFVGDDRCGRADHAPAALRADHLPRRPAVALDRTDLGPLLRAPAGAAAAGHGAGRGGHGAGGGDRLSEHAA